MNKTTVYLSDELKATLARVAKETGRSEAEVIRVGIELAAEKCMPPMPTMNIHVSDDPHFAEKVAENIDQYLVGFGKD